MSDDIELAASRAEFQHMNRVLDAYKAGKATEADYREAWAAFEEAARQARGAADRLINAALHAGPCSHDCSDCLEDDE